MGEKATVSADPRLRAEVYAILALAHHEPPSESFIARIAACAEAARDCGLPELARALSELARYAREEPEEAVRQDFNDLFMVPGPKYLAPYESVYLDPPIEANGKVSPRTFGPSTQAVIAFYGRVGLEISRSYTELPDHIGLGLACMEYLCRREAEYLERQSDAPAQRARALERTFLCEHLSKWLPALEARIREKAETAYYRVLAALTLAWVREEAGRCSED